MSDIGRILMDLELRVSRLESRGARAAPLVASDAELDGEYGDEVVKKDPVRWTGASYAGRRMSECPSEYLELLAGLWDWCARKDEEANKTYTTRNGKVVPSAPGLRKRAAKARGWAKRNAGKAMAHAAPLPLEDDSFDEIPF